MNKFMSYVTAKNKRIIRSYYRNPVSNLMKNGFQVSPATNIGFSEEGTKPLQEAKEYADGLEVNNCLVVYCIQLNSWGERWLTIGYKEQEPNQGEK